MDSTYFSISKSYFLFLYFLCGHSLHFSFSSKPVFCSSFFYATTAAMASTIPCPQTLFSVPQFFMRLWLLLFLLLKACFVFLSFLSDHCLHLSFHNATLVRIMFTTLYP